MWYILLSKSTNCRSFDLLLSLLRDLMTLPEGIYHRFTTDETDMIHAMRLFIGQPVWTPFNRPCNEHESRKKYVVEYMEGVEVEEKKEE